jgi:nucleoside-diphosphate-sugar epimerase
VISSLLRGEPAGCSQGLQQRDFLYSPDVADALVALLDCPVSGAVNIGSGVPLRVGDLAMRIATMLGHPELLRLGEIAAQHDVAPMVVADVRRLSREVGWQPRFMLEQGLTGTIEWWRDRLAADNIVK